MSVKAELTERDRRYLERSLNNVYIADQGA